MTISAMEINLAALVPYSRIYWYAGRAYRYDYLIEELQQVEHSGIGHWSPVWMKDVDRKDWMKPKTRQREIRRLDSAIRDIEFSREFNVNLKEDRYGTRD